MGRAKRKPMRDRTILIRLTEKDRSALQRMADADDRRLAEYVRVILLRHIRKGKGGSDE